MAMSSPTLSALIKTKIKATSTVADDAELTKFCDAVAAAVVEHITAAAVVTVASGIAVSTTGSAVAQTGATTAPGTGTIA